MDSPLPIGGMLARWSGCHTATHQYFSVATPGTGRLPALQQRDHLIPWALIGLLPRLNRLSSENNGKTAELNRISAEYNGKRARLKGLGAENNGSSAEYSDKTAQMNRISAEYNGQWARLKGLRAENNGSSAGYPGTTPVGMGSALPVSPRNLYFIDLITYKHC